MNELICVTQGQIGGSSVQTVNARDLHAFLEVGKDFSTWIKGRIEQYGFNEFQDYVTEQNLSSPVSGSSKSRPQAVIDYHLSLDMAKELAMVERNEKGKQARMYFIECERRAKSAPLIPQSLPEALRLAADLADQKAKVEAALALAAPKVAALDKIAANSKSITITEASKILGVKLNTLTKWLHVNGWVYRSNGSWVAYETQIRSQCLEYKEGHYTDEETGERKYKPYCHVTQKGLVKLAEIFNSGEMAA